MSYKKAYYKILTVLIIVLLAISNPTYEDHKKYVRAELSKEIFGTNKGVIGFDSASGKVVGKTMSKRGNSDSEWVVIEGKLFEVVKGKWKNPEGEITPFSFARSHRKVDENTMEAATHRVNDAGEVGEVAERDGVKRISKWNRKKP